MLWFVLPGAVFALATLAMGALVVRKFPELVLLDVTTISRERDLAIKRGIIHRRARRLSVDILRRAAEQLRPVREAASVRLRHWYSRASELERKHRKIGMASGSGEKITSERRVMEIMNAADALLKNNKVSEAEAKYIEVISMSPKYVKAYESLGRLYMRERQWKEAEETFSFLLKLDPKDASVLANLGELATARGDLKRAMERYQSAVELKPANPKYLDLLLEGALAASDRDVARETFVRLKEVNPENQKLADFETRIREMVAQAKKATVGDKNAETRAPASDS